MGDEDVYRKIDILKNNLKHLEYVTLLHRHNLYPDRTPSIVLIYGMPGKGAANEFLMKDHSAESFMDVEKRIRKAIKLTDEIARLKDYNS